jgi:hypothetical protein
MAERAARDTLITMELPTAPRVVSRSYAIRRLRDHLVALTDDDHSMCRVAAEKGILCRGFARFSDEELRKRFSTLTARRPGMNRWQLEAMANQWELARQIVDRVPIACDAQAIEHDTCKGWDDFSNDDLGRFCADLLGMQVVVADHVPAEDLGGAPPS